MYESNEIMEKYDDNPILVSIKNHFRYNYRGQITTEDLFDLSMEELDAIYKDLTQKRKELDTDSLLERPAFNEETETLDVKRSVVRLVFAQKKHEAAAKAGDIEKRRKEGMILHALDMKKNDELNNKSIEELQAMLDELKQN